MADFDRGKIPGPDASIDASVSFPDAGDEDAGSADAGDASAAATDDAGSEDGG